MSNLSHARRSLYTPDGEVPLSNDVVPINRAQIIMLSQLHEFAQEYQLTIVCKRCNSAIQGRNTGEEAQPAVACQCREFRYTGA